jgi:putative transposase
MPNDRRAFVPGGCFFLHGQSAGAEANPARRPYRALARGGRGDGGNHPFTIDAFVVLPDHLHAVWTLPPGDCDVSTRWRLIKSRFARALPKRDRLSAVRKARAASAASGNGGFGSISSAMTPMTHDMSNIATSIRSSTAWSSAWATGRIHRFHRDVGAGVFPVDWGGDIEAIGDFGER